MPTTRFRISLYDIPVRNNEHLDLCTSREGEEHDLLSVSDNAYEQALLHAIIFPFGIRQTLPFICESEDRN